MYITHRFDKGRKIIRADYQGGAYIDLSFGTEGHNPIEVINVYDYAKGEPEPPFNRFEEMTTPKKREAIRETVKSWIEDQREEGWDSFYEDYIRNSY